MPSSRSTSRIFCHKIFDLLCASISPVELSSIRCAARSLTDAEIPSRRITIVIGAFISMPASLATPRGRMAADPGSCGVANISVIIFVALAISSAGNKSERLVSGRGNVLRVISSITAKVPKEPHINFDRS